MVVLVFSESAILKDLADLEVFVLGGGDAVVEWGERVVEGSVARRGKVVSADPRRREERDCFGLSCLRPLLIVRSSREGVGLPLTVTWSVLEGE